MLSMPLEESMICIAVAWERPAHDFPLIDTSTSFSHRPPRHALLLFLIWKSRRERIGMKGRTAAVWFSCLHPVALLLLCPWQNKIRPKLTVLPGWRISPIMWAVGILLVSVFFLIPGTLLSIGLIWSPIRVLQSRWNTQEHLYALLLFPIFYLGSLCFREETGILSRLSLSLAVCPFIHLYYASLLSS